MDEQINSMMEERRARLELVKTNILNAQKMQNEHYARKHSNSECFQLDI